MFIVVAFKGSNHYLNWRDIFDGETNTYTEFKYGHGNINIYR